MLVYLRFRDDYTPRSRRVIQRCVARGDLAEFARLMAEPDNWPCVPRDRFERRRKILYGGERGLSRGLPQRRPTSTAPSRGCSLRGKMPL